MRKAKNNKLVMDTTSVMSIRLPKKIRVLLDLIIRYSGSKMTISQALEAALANYAVSSKYGDMTLYEVLMKCNLKDESYIDDSANSYLEYIKNLEKVAPDLLTMEDKICLLYSIGFNFDGVSKDTMIEEAKDWWYGSQKTYNTATFEKF